MRPTPPPPRQGLCEGCQQVQLPVPMNNAKSILENLSRGMDIAERKMSSPLFQISPLPLGTDTVLRLKGGLNGQKAKWVSELVTLKKLYLLVPAYTCLISSLFIRLSGLHSILLSINTMGLLFPHRYESFTLSALPN